MGSGGDAAGDLVAEDTRRVEPEARGRSGRQKDGSKGFPSGLSHYRMGPSVSVSTRLGPNSESRVGDWELPGRTGDKGYPSRSLCVYFTGGDVWRLGSRVPRINSRILTPVHLQGTKRARSGLLGEPGPLT